MEKPNFLVNGGIKLPVGYRFHPTDEELVVHYLKRKFFGVPLPASVIPEYDVFQTDPWSLPGDLKEKRYFFSQKKGNDSEIKRKRAAGLGYWKPTCKGIKIVASARNQAVGIRKTLVFSEGKHSDAKQRRTEWVMHEFCLVGSAEMPNTSQVFGDWAVYRIFQRKRRPQKHGVISKPSSINKNQMTQMISPCAIDFMMEENSDAAPPQPSSPCSSGITEVSSNGLDQEEINSLISFSSFYSYMRKT